MIRPRYLAAAGLALALAACASHPSPAVELAIADGSLAIDTGYGAVEQACVTFCPSLPPATKAQVKADLHKVLQCQGSPPVCTGFLKAAHDAKKIGDQATMVAQIVLAEQVISEIKGLLPPGAVK